MNFRNRIKQIEQKAGFDKTGDKCRCDNPYLKIGSGRNCQSCGKEFDFNYYRDAEIIVIEPESEVL